MNQPLLTPKQTAEKLNVSTRTLRRWKNAGIIKPAPSATGKIVYHPAQVVKLTSQKFAPQTPTSVLTAKTSAQVGSPNTDYPILNTAVPMAKPPASFRLPLPPESSPLSEMVITADRVTPPKPEAPAPRQHTMLASAQPLPPLNAIAMAKTSGEVTDSTLPPLPSDLLPPVNPTMPPEKAITKPSKKSSDFFSRPPVIYATVFVVILMLVGGGILLSKIINPGTTDSRSQAFVDQNGADGQSPAAPGDIGSFLGGKITIGSDTGELSNLDALGNLNVSGDAFIYRALHLSPQAPPQRPGSRRPVLQPENQIYTVL